MKNATDDLEAMLSAWASGTLTNALCAGCPPVVAGDFERMKALFEPLWQEFVRRMEARLAGDCPDGHRAYVEETCRLALEVLTSPSAALEAAATGVPTPAIPAPRRALVVTRRRGEALTVRTPDGEHIEVEVHDAPPGKIKLAVLAPRTFRVMRREVARDTVAPTMNRPKPTTSS